jgi:hypothetical protein
MGNGVRTGEEGLVRSVPEQRLEQRLQREAREHDQREPDQACESDAIAPEAPPDERAARCGTRKRAALRTC